MSKKTKRLKKDSKRTERLIYFYWDGTQERRIDPLDVQYALSTQDNFDMDTDTKLASSTLAGPEAAAALRRIVNAVRVAFKVEAYTEGPPERGLTSGECMALLYDFAQFVEGLKKKLGLSQTSLPSDALQVENSLTPNGADSSHIVPGSSQPEPLSTQPELLSSSEASSPSPG